MIHSASQPPSLRSDPHVWLLRDGDPFPAWVTSDAALTSAELERAASLRHPVAKAQFLRGRTVLRSALGLRLGCKPEEVVIRLTPDGKPVLDAAEVIHFNMSHTDGFALFAIASQPIGVDIEAADAKRDCDGLVRRFFTPMEQAEYFGIDPEQRPAAFLRGWTCKEALLKAIGSGVRDLQNCAVRTNPDAAPEVLLSPGSERWTLDAGEVEPGIAWAVARSANRG